MISQQYRKENLGFFINAQIIVETIHYPKALNLVRALNPNITRQIMADFLT